MFTNEKKFANSKPVHEVGKCSGKVFTNYGNMYVDANKIHEFKKYS